MRNPDKKRFLDASRHVETQQVPLFEVDPDMSVARQILGKELPMDRHAYELPVDDYVELNLRMGNDMVYFAHIWRLGRKERKDEAGRIHYIDGTMKTPNDLRSLWYPDLDAQRRRLEELLDRLEGTGMGVVCCTQSSPFVVATAMGYQDFWIHAKLNPGFVDDFIKLIHEWCLRELEAYLRFPVDVVKTGSSFVTKTGPTCSPAMLERLETRYLAEQVQMAKERGKLVLHHVDGNVMAMIPGFIDMGIDILHPIEPCAGLQDIYQIKAKYGDRIALCGNIDVDGVLMHGSPEEITHDVCEHIDRLAGGGGYICSSSHDLHELIPVKNFYAMRDAVHEHRYRPGPVAGQTAQHKSNQPS